MGRSKALPLGQPHEDVVGYGATVLIAAVGVSAPYYDRTTCEGQAGHLNNARGSNAGLPGTKLLHPLLF
jgi:hypothetical protein